MGNLFLGDVVKRLGVINIDNEDIELIRSLKNEVVREFLSTQNVVDNRFDNDIDEVLKDYKVVDLLVLSDLEDLLSGYYWSIILKRFSTFVPISVSVNDLGFVVVDGDTSPIACKVESFVEDSTFSLDELRKLAEECRNNEDKTDIPSVICDIAQTCHINLNDYEDTEEDEEDTDTPCDWVVKLHIGYHPAYTISELSRRISRRMRYKWDNVTASKISVKQNDDATYDAVIFVKYNEGSKQYTQEEMENEIKYRFGKDCPRSWYRCNFVSATPTA